MHRLYILDLDGTLYRGREAVPGAADAVAELRRRGAMVRFLTNNSSQTPEFQAAKLKDLGFGAEPHEVLTSGMGAAHYLADNKIETAYVVGEPGLVEVIRAKGITVTDQAQAVVVGICRDFTYELMSRAMQQILDGGKFIATNTDATYPMEGGRLIPGAGSIVAAVQICSGKEPYVIGKPNPFLIRMLLEEAGVEPGECLVVGDRYETDIVSGQNAGCDTLLVMTGVTEEAPAGQAFAPSVRDVLGY